MKVCVVGDSGLLGQALVQQISSSAANDVIGISTSLFKPTPYWQPLVGRYGHEVCNALTEKDRLAAIIEKFQPDVLINCIALTNLLGCEKNPQLSEALNADIPQALSKLSQQKSISFIHISTDQVFDGKKNEPYTEDDLPSPINNYGKTKLKGERVVLSENPNALILRTNIVGFKDSSVQPTFAEWLSGALYRGEAITLFEDYVTSSIHVIDFSELLLRAYAKGLKGIWHIATQDSASKYQFGLCFAEKAGLNFSGVKKGKLQTANLVPERPPYLALEVSRAEKALERSFPKTIDTVSRLVREFRSRMKEVSCA